MSISNIETGHVTLGLTLWDRSMCEVHSLVRSIFTHHTDSPSHPVKMRERDRGAIPTALWHNRVVE